MTTGSSISSSLAVSFLQALKPVTIHTVRKTAIILLINLIIYSPCINYVATMKPAIVYSLPRILYAKHKDRLHILTDFVKSFLQSYHHLVHIIPGNNKRWNESYYISSCRKQNQTIIKTFGNNILRINC